MPHVESANPMENLSRGGTRKLQGGSLEIGISRPVHSELNQPQASRCYDDASFLPMARLRSMSRARTSQDS